MDGTAAERLRRDAAAWHVQVRRLRADDSQHLAALRRYDGLLAELAAAVGVERPPLTDRSPAGRNRRRAEVERLLADAGVEVREGT